MRTVELTTVDLTTKHGRLKWLEYKNDPEWKLINSCLGTKAVFEKIQHEIIDGKIYSHELDQWVDYDEYLKNKNNDKETMDYKGQRLF